MQLSPRAGRVGSPVVKRMSPSGVPTYYYYYAPSATSSPISRSSAVSTPPPAMSPVASGPHSPNFQHHHRQLPAAPTPSSPFHFPQPHQQQYYGTMTSVVEEQHHGPVHPQHHSPVPQHHSSSSLHHHYGVHPALLQQSHCFFSPPASPSPPRTPPPSHPMVQHPQRMVQTPCPSPSIGHRQVTVPQAHQQSQRTTTRTTTASGTSAVAIDNKIEQAMDLVKSHLMFAVREEVEVLKEKIAELMERINQLEAENSILKANASTETLAQLGGGGQAQAS